MVPIMKGSRSARFPGRRLAAPLVEQGGASNIIPAQWVHGGHHEPIHDDAERIHQVAKSAYRFAPQFFACEQTNRINGRRITCNTLGKSTEASRSRPRFPGGSDIAFAHEKRGRIASQLPSFSISRTVVRRRLRCSNEMRRKWESRKGSPFRRHARRSWRSRRVMKNRARWTIRWADRGGVAVGSAPPLSPRVSRGRCAGRHETARSRNG
jgi:hypothetical protein